MQALTSKSLYMVFISRLGGHLHQQTVRRGRLAIRTKTEACLALRFGGKVLAMPCGLVAAVQATATCFAQGSLGGHAGQQQGFLCGAGHFSDELLMFPLSLPVCSSGCQSSAPGAPWGASWFGGRRKSTLSVQLEWEDGQRTAFSRRLFL